jgi:hypothetical protein
MEKILARRFSPFNFFVVLGFPNVVPTPNEWSDYFPIFRKHKEDNPTQHLHEFHELMHQWKIHHEDVLMNMFMFSLAGYAHQMVSLLTSCKHFLPKIISCSFQ